MKKTWIIIQREYLSRVKKKSFLVTTLLIPILMVIFMIGAVYLVSKSEEKQKILVIDQSNFFKDQIQSNSKSFTVEYIKSPPQLNNDDILNQFKSDILVRIYPFVNGKADSIHLFKKGGVSLVAKEFIQNELNGLYQIEQMKLAGIDRVEIDSINKSSLPLKSFDLENNHETNSEIAMAIGYAMGILIYMIILIYGTGVMRGVMEEKTNRIAEVIISSVKPFQLMMGKIIGIAMVGLTQFAIWLMLMSLLQIILLPLIPGMQEMMMTKSNVTMDSHEMNHQLMGFIQSLQSQNWILNIGAFLFYFLGGYFLYASMFAAVGSLVNEDPQDAQQMSIPITLPIIFGFVIMSSTMKDPNSSFSIFGSLFPLTSPIVMMARIPYGVPFWQIIFSMLFLIIGFIFMTWVSAKIYRTGILMYGKKASWKEVVKWLKIS